MKAKNWSMRGVAVLYEFEYSNVRYWLLTDPLSGSQICPFLPGDLNRSTQHFIDRPISEPFVLVLDEYNYLVDPNFDYGSVTLPTHRERLLLEGLEADDLKDELNTQIWEIEHLITNMQFRWADPPHGLGKFEI